MNQDQRPTMKITARAMVDDVVEEKPEKVRRSVVSSKAGTHQLSIAGVLSGLCLAPLVLSKFQYELVAAGANMARSVAPRFTGSEPYLWPSVVSLVAFAASVLVIGLAVSKVKLPLVFFRAMGAVFAVCTGFVAWQVIDFINAPAWFLLPVMVLLVGAFVLSLTTLARGKAALFGHPYLGSAVMQVLFCWALVALFLIGGLAAVRASQDSPISYDSQQQTVTLASVHDADATSLGALHGTFVPQIASAVVVTDADATTYLARHEDLGARWPVVLVQGTDMPSETLDAQDWRTLVAQSFATEPEAQAWCTTQALGPGDCLPRWVP